MSLEEESLVSAEVDTEVWAMPVEGFRNRVATDGSVLRVSGWWSACGWSGVQLDHGGEVRPIHGMCGTLGC